MELQKKCLDFGSRCMQRLKDVFHSIGASSDKFTPSAENLPSTLEYIEGEVDALDEVIAGHADFCALLASRGTATAFLRLAARMGKL
jgi:predicted dienelactone hydrolase